MVSLVVGFMFLAGLSLIFAATISANDRIVARIIGDDPKQRWFQSPFWVILAGSIVTGGAMALNFLGCK